jgi:hypothetical protein
VIGWGDVSPVPAVLNHAFLAVPTELLVDSTRPSCATNLANLTLSRGLVRPLAVISTVGT